MISKPSNGSKSRGKVNLPDKRALPSLPDRYALAGRTAEI